MIDFSQASIKEMVVHYAGNQELGESAAFSKEALVAKEEWVTAISDVVFALFPVPEKYFFENGNEASGNVVYSAVAQIFNEESSLVEGTKSITEHIHELSTHPNITAGNIVYALVENILVDDELVNGIALLSYGKHGPMLNTQDNGHWEPRFSFGLGLKRTGPSLLILNTAEDEGYRAMIYEKSAWEGNFWKNNFLGMVRVADENLQTSEYLNICKDFAKKVIAKEDKREQVEFLNKSLDYFSEKEDFNLEEFSDEVLEKPEYVAGFKDYTQQISDEGEKVIEGNFQISQPAVAKMARKLKDSIKLDTNIEIKMTGAEVGRDIKKFLERGYDEDKGMSFYKVYFHSEK